MYHNNSAPYSKYSAHKICKHLIYGNRRIAGTIYYNAAHVYMHAIVTYPIYLT